MCDVPSLPGEQTKVHFLGIQGEAESSEEGFQKDRFEFYGQNLVDSESGTEGGVESGFGAPQRDAGRTTDLTAIMDHGSLPQLSSWGRAFLKRYFEETDAFRLPEGNPVLAFTESQVYNLLSVLTDETIRKPYTTIEVRRWSLMLPKEPLQQLRRKLHTFDPETSTDPCTKQ